MIPIKPLGLSEIILYFLPLFELTTQTLFFRHTLVYRVFVGPVDADVWRHGAVFRVFVCVGGVEFLVHGNGDEIGGVRSFFTLVSFDLGNVLARNPINGEH
jgi:hypothetical protein